MSDPRAAAPTEAGSAADLGEFGLIDAIRRRLPQGKYVKVGPGDDAAVVMIDQVPTVLTTDVLVAGVHFRTDWAEAYDIGRRAAAASLADVVAMGAHPVALVVALVMPTETEAAWALRLTDGLRDEAASVGASVVGGDVSSGPVTSVTVSALGDLKGRAPVLRSGAKPGDQLALAGRLGWAEAGLAVLGRGFGTPRALVEAYRRPEVEYAAALRGATAGAHAMCDVSDGLVADVGHIAAASDVRIDIDSERLEVADPVAAVASAYGVDPLAWVLGGGHDHAFVATFAPKKRLPKGFVPIGSVSDLGDGASDLAVTVDGQAWAASGAGGSGSPGAGGYRHFR